MGQPVHTLPEKLCLVHFARLLQIVFGEIYVNIDPQPLGSVL